MPKNNDPSATSILVESPFDPLALLTPDAVAGIKPLLRLITDGLKDTPYISYAESVQIRHTAAFLEQVRAGVEV